ncbi:MAG: MerR family transcriptional regulator [Chitinophagia bacterium]|nr:MerR family transcriptional regulator [Chitinophagia bacterium]
MNAFTIKDLENLTGIKAHTIRIWEQRYNFLKPQRTETNIRYYTNEELKTVLNISLLNKYGYKISHIDRMDVAEMQQRILQLTDTQAVQERIVNELVQEMIDLQVEKIDRLLGDHIEQKGVERTVLKLIFPFLEKIGILWLTGHINPAQEHLVTNVIRQKLLVAIDRTPLPVDPKQQVMLFLPEGEYHELGLLFLYYLMKSRGLATIYLGANVPIKDVAYVVKLKKPDIIFSHLTSTASNFSMEKFLNKVSLHFTGTPTIISGSQTLYYKKSIPPGVSFKQSLAEVMDLITELSLKS